MANPKISAGILLYRCAANKLYEVLLVHPGGPFHKFRDKGAWSIPKGEYDENEEPLAAAKREFREELGIMPPDGLYIELKKVKQKGGKIVTAFACEASVDCEKIISNLISIEYPYRSGKFIDIPEVDKAAWFVTPEAKEKINAAQVAFIDELEEKLKKDED